MKNWKCHPCQTLHEEEDLATEVIRNWPHEPDDIMKYCPDCLSDDIEEVILCDTCEINEPLNEDVDDCAECIIANKFSHMLDYPESVYKQASEGLKRG